MPSSPNLDQNTPLAEQIIPTMAKIVNIHSHYIRIKINLRVTLKHFLPPFHTCSQAVE